MGGTEQIYSSWTLRRFKLFFFSIFASKLKNKIRESEREPVKEFSNVPKAFMQLCNN